MSKAGDLIWEPFAGSGTTGVAAVTCMDWHLKDNKWSKVLAQRRGIGCDVMECWAKIAKYRIREAQHPELSDALHQDKTKEANPEPGNQGAETEPDEENDNTVDADKAA